MKIGITTHYHKSKNYGGNLQAYALCRVLNELGHSAEQISFDKRETLKTRVKRTIKRLLHPSLKNRRSFKVREKAFESFNQGLIPHSRVYNEKSISSCLNDYDAFITGSDQVWHPYAVCDAYLLSFVPSNKIKLSYAASVAHSELTEAQKDRYKRALSDYKAISVRENEGKELISPLAPCKVEVTLDPTLLLSKEQWLEVAKEYEIKEKYLFCYFLGESTKQRELAKEYAIKNNLKIVTLPNLLGRNRECDKNFGDYKLYDVSPQQLLSIINCAECVFTDSFHATVFSLIFEKEHFVFLRNGKKAMSSRITTLTSLFGTQSHFCDEEKKTSLEYIESCEKIDFSKERVEFFKTKEQSIRFLINGIEESVSKTQKAINIVDKKNCSGCHACAEACPVNCIEMIRDKEGFLYPQVNHEKCVQCGLCINSCPIATPTESNRSRDDVQAFGAYNRNEEIRRNSSSGGVFTAIAENIIENGGIVFGAAFNYDFTVSHKEVDTVDGLGIFRGSKYVQSEIGDAYKKAKIYLDQGKNVLFSGTPCQIAGLYSYLNKEYSNLITQDLICHGVPSPTVWRKYLNQREKNAGENIRSVFFKDKETGWKTYSITIKFENGKQYTERASKDLMMRSFIANLCLRPSCHKCSFKKVVRQSDITLADYWGINRINPQLDDDKGTSLVIVNSSKGRKMLEDIKNKIVKFDADLDAAIVYNSSMIKSVKESPNRESFMKKINSNGFDMVAKMHLKQPLKTRIKRKIKKIIKKILNRR